MCAWRGGDGLQFPLRDASTRPEASRFGEQKDQVPTRPSQTQEFTEWPQSRQESPSSASWRPPSTEEPQKAETGATLYK